MSATITTNIASFIQLAVIGMNVFFIAVMLRQKESRLSKFMLCIAFLCAVQNIGYLLEVTSENLSEVMRAISVEYAGAAIITTILFAFAMEYCGVNLPKWIMYGMVCFDGLVVACVWAYEYTPLYYSSVDFVTNGIMPHVELGKGILYIINGVKLFGLIFAEVIVALKTSVKTLDKNRRSSCRLLAICSSAPFFGYIINLFGLLGGYDAVPVLEAIGIFIFGMTIVHQHVFDIAATAHENIIAEMHDAIIIIDKSGGYVDSNKSAKKIFGELIENKGGKKIRDDRLNRLLESCVRNADTSVEYVIEDRIYDVRFNEIKNGKLVSGYIISMFDITEERARFENMKKLKHEADKANRAKSEFLARMSHEIRSPINAIIGMNEMILRESNEKEIREYSYDVRSSADTLLGFVNDLLDSSKIESDKMEINSAEYNLKELIIGIKNMIEVKAEEKNLQLILKVDENLPVNLYGDDVRLKQILVNLLTNAVKYTPKGKVIFSVDGSVSGNMAVLNFAVEDTGVGIKEENIPHLFNAYERVTIGKNRYIEGTGLGLNISSQLAALMGSELKVESVYGKGSRFYFELKQEIKGDALMGSFKADIKESVEEYNYKERFMAPAAKVLVVDDSRINLKVFSGLLKETKMQITCAESGAKCLELVKDSKFDLIFLDHMMPEMDGIETFHHLKNMEGNKCADTPIIMLTANATEGVKEQYIEEGFDEFLSKPIDAKALERMIEEFLPKELIVKQ